MSCPPDPASVDRRWLAAYPPGVPHDYHIPPVSLLRLLDDAARDFPDAPAIASRDGEVAYGNLRDHVTATAAVLARLGVRRGDAVLVALPHGASLPIALLALWRLRAVAVPVDPDAAPDNLARTAGSLPAAAAVGTDTALRALAHADRLPAIAALVTGSEWTVPGRLASLVDRLPIGLVRRTAGRRRSMRHGAVALADELATADAERTLTGLPPEVDDPAVVTSHVRPDGDVEAAVLTHGNLVAGAFQARLWVPDVQASRERILLAGSPADPRMLGAGTLMGLLAAACLLPLQAPDPATLCRTVETEAPTLLCTTPRVLAGLLTSDGHRRDLSSLRVCLVLGGPLDPALAAAVERRAGGARVREANGPAGMGALTHAQPVYGRFEPGTLGLPLPGTLAAVVAPDDLSRPLPPGEPGRLLVRGPQVPAAFWARPHRTAARIRAGWYVTSDLTTMDGDGASRPAGRPDSPPQVDHDRPTPGTLPVPHEQAGS